MPKESDRELLVRIDERVGVLTRKTGYQSKELEKQSGRIRKVEHWRTAFAAGGSVLMFMIMLILRMVL